MVRCEPCENLIPAGVILNRAVFQALGRIRRAGHHVWGNSRARSLSPLSNAGGRDDAAGKAHKKFKVPALRCTAIDKNWLPGAWPVLTRLLWHVAMHNFHTIAGAPKMFAYFLGDHDGTVLSARTAERDGQIALAFMNVVR